MDGPGSDARVEAVLAWCGRAAVLLVLGVGALTFVGWATGRDLLTRLYPTWPQMMPWTAVWLAALGAAILAQYGHPSRWRVWLGRGLAALVGVQAGIVLAEYVTGGSFGLDQLWFGDAVRVWQSTWPGRPSVQTAASVLLLAATAALIRVDRGIRVVWLACGAAAAAIPFVTVGAYLFNALALVGYSPTTGQALLTALALLRSPPPRCWHGPTALRWPGCLAAQTEGRCFD